METYEITQEDVERKEAGPKGWFRQFWKDVFGGLIAEKHRCSFDGTMYRFWCGDRVVVESPHPLETTVRVRCLICGDALTDNDLEKIFHSIGRPNGYER